jgi:CRISPR-associated protein Csd1
LQFPLADPDERSAALKRLGEGSELISFRVNGTILIQFPEIKAWWASHVAKEREQVLNVLSPGADFYQAGVGKLTEYAPVVFKSIPFVSYDKAPFMSFGLGKQTTPYRLETVEKAAAALNWLLASNDCNKQMGDLTAVFWAADDRQVTSGGFVELLESKDPLTVKDFFSGIWASTAREIDAMDFYSAILSKSKGRFAVCSWHTETLANAQKNVRRWLTALALPTTGSEEPRYIPISDLAACTVRKSKETRPSPATYLSLFEAALFGSSLPQKLFSATLIRQSLEIAKGCGKKQSERGNFENRLAARTALVKLFFELTKGVSMTDLSEDNPALENDPGYLCGRLLAVLDKIHVEAHRESGGTSSSPANRSYAAASTTPVLIFPQLCKLARYHLNKVGGGWAYRLEHGYPEENFPGLAAICARLRTTANHGFPPTLTLEQQGRFAIGFYYERCRPWPKREQPGKVTP